MSPRQPSQPVDLLDLQGDDYGAFTSAPLVPDHIHLPPRPSEISPDYVPPLRSPRRLSSFSFPGPSSPPQLSEIVFDPLENAGPPRNFGTAQSKLFNTLATTTKLASKWKTVLDPNLYNTPDRHPPSATALPIDVNHASPFAYTHASPSRTTASSAPHPRSTLEWSGTVLSGRRSATSSVLTSSIADQASLRVSQFAKRRSSGNIFLPVRDYLPIGHSYVSMPLHEAPTISLAGSARGIAIHLVPPGRTASRCQSKRRQHSGCDRWARIYLRSLRQ